MSSTHIPRRRNWKRVFRVSVGVVATVAVLTGISTVANASITASEKSSITPYGQKVTIDDGDINVYRNGGAGSTMVLLSGFGTPAPAVDFAPLVRELSAYDVIVVEGFGYGYSDADVPDRTIENITSGLHAVLDQLQVNGPVTLVGHSVGGLYARYYANAYPNEVAAFIGIDPMAAKETSLEVGTPSSSEAIQNTLGLFRLVTTIAPDIIQPPGTSYTTDERTRTAAMTNWNYGNVSISDEWSRIGANSTKAAAQSFAVDLPVLEILSSESIANIPDWRGSHEAELAGVATQQLEVVEGAHYLHWTQAPALARMISDFMTKHVAG